MLHTGIEITSKLVGDDNLTPHTSLQLLVGLSLFTCFNSNYVVIFGLVILKPSLTSHSHTNLLPAATFVYIRKPVV